MTTTCSYPMQNRGRVAKSVTAIYHFCRDHGLVSQ